MSRRETAGVVYAQTIARELATLQACAMALAKVTPMDSSWVYRTQDLTVAAWHYVNAVKNSQRGARKSK